MGDEQKDVKMKDAQPKRTQEEDNRNTRRKLAHVEFSVGMYVDYDNAHKMPSADVLAWKSKVSSLSDGFSKQVMELEETKRLRAHSSDRSLDVNFPVNSSAWASTLLPAAAAPH